MSRLRPITLFLLAASPLLAQQPRDYPVKPRKITIPFAFQQCEQSGRLDNFDRAAAVLRGESIANKKPPVYPFDNTDLYKVIEGSAYTLSVVPDPKLEACVDSRIARIAAAHSQPAGPDRAPNCSPG